MLRQPGAAFVTLTLDRRLLGCVGTMASVEPLVAVVADRTLAAAFCDPCTRGVAPEDYAFLDIEVSVLSPMEQFAVASYEELVVQVRCTREGLLVEPVRRRATFLPAVWDQLTDPREFVETWWHKADRTERAWPAGISLWRSSATKAVGPSPRAPLASRDTARSTPSP